MLELDGFHEGLTRLTFLITAAIVVNEVQWYVFERACWNITVRVPVQTKGIYQTWPDPYTSQNFDSNINLLRNILDCARIFFRSRFFIAQAAFSLQGFCCRKPVQSALCDVSNKGVCSLIPPGLSVKYFWQIGLPCWDILVVQEPIEALHTKSLCSEGKQTRLVKIYGVTTF